MTLAFLLVAATNTVAPAASALPADPVPISAPTVAALSPTSGPAGTSVTITGTNLVAVSGVTFGGVAATSIVSNSATSLTVVVPAHAAGAVDVVVTATCGVSTGGPQFTFTAAPPSAPTLTSLAPTSGAAAGGTSVVITGTGFTGATAVTFGGTAAATYTVDSATQITATTPVHAAGAVTVVVTAPGGVASTVGGFTYVAGPTITSVGPTAGPVAGGTSIEVAGTGFVVGATTLTVGGSAATSVTVVSDTALTAVTPAHGAGVVDLVATTSAGSGTLVGGYTYTAGPTIASLSPTSGPVAGGTSITVTGTGFVMGLTTLTVGGSAATSITVVSATSLTASTPAHAAGAADVVVTTSAGSDTSVGGFTYVATPTATSLTPFAGPTAGGTSVTITGTHFVVGATSVTIGGSAVPAGSVTVVSATSLTFSTPAHAPGPVAVSVTTPGGSASVSSGYIYAVPPSATSLSPTSGSTAGGTSVTVTGSGFAPGATTVTFDGTVIAAGSVTVNSATSLTVSSPAHAIGAVDVSVTAPGGSATLVGGYTYTAATPTITTVSPDSGDIGGGQTITITGTLLSGVTAVTFGGTAGTSVTQVSPTQVSAVAPAHAMGVVNVVVTVTAGTATKVGGYEFTSSEEEAAAVHVHTARFVEPETISCGPLPPSAPTDLTATAGVSSITVAWTASVAHGSPVTGYTVTALPGPATCTTTTTTCVLGGTAGVSYTVTVLANSAVGASPAAGPSTAAIPTDPVVATSPPDTSLTLTTDKGHITTAVPGQDIVVIGTGFAAHSTATITIYSTPLNLGTVVTDGSGNFSKPVVIPAGLVSGAHQVVAQGVAPDGTARAMKLAVTVAAASSTASSTASGLPVTGSPVLSILATGLIMLLAGVWVLYLTRRRTLTA